MQAAAIRDINEAIGNAREESWKEVLEDVITEADDVKLWGIVKSLNESLSLTARNEVMIYKNKTIASEKR